MSTAFATTEIRSSLAESIASCLSAAQVRYCFLTSPFEVAVAVESVDRRLKQVLHRVGYGVRTLSMWQNAVGSWRVHLLVGGRIERLNIFSESSSALARNEFTAMMQSAETGGNPDPIREFQYLALRYALGGRANTEEQAALAVLAQSIGNPLAALYPVFGSDAQALLGTLSPNAFAGQLRAVCSSLRAPMWRQRMRQSLGQRWLKIARWARNLWNPSGLVIVALGPDGVGKSTTTNAMIEATRELFDEASVSHWRPMLIFPVPARGLKPHDRPPRSKLKSALYLLTILADCWLGYLFRVRPSLARNGLVIFDRYFIDILVDPLRYRYGGPTWLAPLLLKLVPPRQRLTLVCHADPEAVHIRKKELALEEIHRQITAYRDLASRISDSVLIDTNLESTCCSAAGTMALYEYMATRFAHS